MRLFNSALKEAGQGVIHETSRTHSYSMDSDFYSLDDYRQEPLVSPVADNEKANEKGIFTDRPIKEFSKPAPLIIASRSNQVSALALSDIRTQSRILNELQEKYRRLNNKTSQQKL